ncbi:unnamed protein product [Effrenium voratum]|uniref:Endonuclease/exonuclease/phosphatase domain-containing protein n=1 Tax=Effrenium voratum TaxID=2562239 RepID=A0AA36IMS6_9DINO|nr:unnamed protein product [Effrenium voratum]
MRRSRTGALLLAVCAQRLPLLFSGRHIRMDVASLPRGAPLDANPKHLSVLSYNILAPAFVRPLDLRTGEIQPFAAFQWASEEDLDWEQRKVKILEQIRAWRADVVCLQEVEFKEESGSFSLPDWLELEGYSACLPGDKYLTLIAERNERVLANKVATGCALLFRTARLARSGTETDGSGDPNTLVSACLVGVGDLTLDPTAFFAVHLDAQSEEKRVEQLKKCLDRARALGTRNAVLAGDMNTECLPGSCVQAMISREPVTQEQMARECASALRLKGDEEEDSEGAVGAKGAEGSSEPSEEQLEQWRVLWDKAAVAPREQRIELLRVPTGPTRSSYEHGKTEGPCVTWSLDHVFYSPRTLRLLSKWTALEADPDSAASGLPNAQNPSDHLPVAAIFEASPTPCLDAAARQQLEQRLGDLELRHSSQLAELEAGAAGPRWAAGPLGRWAALKEMEPKAEADEVAAKAKSKKKGDSPEVIAFKQEKRRRSKELKAKHQAEREEFWSPLGQEAIEVAEVHVLGSED